MPGESGISLRPWPIWLLLLLSFSPVATSLRVVSSSPCESKCETSSGRNLTDHTVCLDAQFETTSNGTQFQECVECQLDSKAVDSSSGASDVTWGLYHLRYAFSTCVFNFPTKKISVSTPCQVSCDPLKDAVQDQLANNTEAEHLDFCSHAGFQDTEGINRCAECYSQMEEQSYMANFLQALHVACLDPPAPSETFPVAARDIFGSAPIPTPTPSSDDDGGSGKPANLPLIIALPVVFGVLIIASVIVCCFYSARRRRRIMADRNNMRAYHDKASPTDASSTRHLSPSGQLQSPSSEFYSPPSAHRTHFSPYMDQAETPYPHFPSSPPPVAVGGIGAGAASASPEQPVTHFSQHLSPESAGTAYPHRPYSPAQYATQGSGSNNPQPVDSSRIGPASEQSPPHALHDQGFPLPPPPSHLPPAGSSTQMPTSQANTSSGGVESLSQHHRKTPSLVLPVPKKKKGGADQAPRIPASLDAPQRSPALEPPRAVQANDLPLQGDEAGTAGAASQAANEAPWQQDAADTGSPAQTFVYDEAQGRYVKQAL